MPNKYYNWKGVKAPAEIEQSWIDPEKNLLPKGLLNNTPKSNSPKRKLKATAKSFSPKKRTLKVTAKAFSPKRTKSYANALKKKTRKN